MKNVTPMRLLPPTKESLSRGIAELTERELAVLALMAEGLSNTGISTELVVGIRTVESHVATIFMKLGLWPDESHQHRRVQAILAYQRAYVASPAASAAASPAHAAVIAA